jgi:hypothetical protein
MLSNHLVGHESKKGESMEIIATSPITVIPGMLCWTNPPVIRQGRIVKVVEPFAQEDERPSRGKKRMRYHKVEREDGEECLIATTDLQPIYLKPVAYSMKTERFAREVSGWDLVLGQRILIARLPLYLLTGHRESLTIGRVAVIRPNEGQLIIFTSIFRKGPETAHELLIQTSPQEIRIYSTEEITALAGERHFYFEDSLLREELEGDLANYPGLDRGQYEGLEPPE